MGLFDRVEAKLAATINGAFARAFKAEVQPVEIAAAMRKAMDDKAAILDADRAIVPNAYVIELSPQDHERLTAYADLLTEELIASAEEHLTTQHYRAAGHITIAFDKIDSLETGVFRVRSTSDRNARPGKATTNEHGRGPRRPGEVIETHRTGDDPAWRVPRNQAYPPEATAQAEDEIGMASHAAAAATGAAAGTAAARDMWEQARNDQPELSEAERAAQRRSDLDAWNDGIPDADHAGRAGQTGHAGNTGYTDQTGYTGNAGQTGRASQAGYTGHTGQTGHSGDAGHASRDGHAGDTRDADNRRHHDTAPPTRAAAWDGTAAPPEIPEHLRPDPASRPWIDVDGDAYPLLGAITVIGRDPHAEITLDDGGISRRHCEIRVTHDGPHLVIGLRDLGSTNGTFVNGERVNTARLDNGDRITIGRVSFVLHTRRR